PMEVRVAFVAKDAEELIEQLQAFIAHKPAIKGCYRGSAKQGKESISLFTADNDAQELMHKWLVKAKLPKLAEAWVKGLAIDWSSLHGNAKPRRISAPTYPFA